MASLAKFRNMQNKYVKNVKDPATCGIMVI